MLWFVEGCTHHGIKYKVVIGRDNIEPDTRDVPIQWEVTTWTKMVVSRPSQRPTHWNNEAWLVVMVYLEFYHTKVYPCGWLRMIVGVVRRVMLPLSCQLFIPLVECHWWYIAHRLILEKLQPSYLLEQHSFYVFWYIIFTVWLVMFLPQRFLGIHLRWFTLYFTWFWRFASFLCIFCRMSW